MSIAKDSRRDHKGQFGKGNLAASKRYRRSRVSTTDLINLVDKKLIELGESRKFKELLAETTCKLLLAAAEGDKRAAVWVIERFCPRDIERHVWPEALPSPSDEPKEYLDALVNAVTRAEISAAQAASLSQLARPFVIDAELSQLASQFAELQREVEFVSHKPARGAGEKT